MHANKRGNPSEQLKEILFHDLAQLGMSVETFADNANVSYTTVRTWLARGRIPQRNYGRVIRVLGKDSSFAKSINPENRTQDVLQQLLTLAKRLQDSEDRIHNLEGRLLALEHQVDPLLR